jgi:hypothetical protein
MRKLKYTLIVNQKESERFLVALPVVHLHVLLVIIDQEKSVYRRMNMYIFYRFHNLQKF